MSAKRKFVCTEPCFHNSHRYFLGDIVTATMESLPKRRDKKDPEKWVLAHFEPLDKGEEVVVEGNTEEVVVNDKRRKVRV